MRKAIPVGDLDLAGTAAVVTGVGSPRGIGYAVARALSARGASLVISATGHRVHQRASELATGTVAVAGDLTHEGTAKVTVNAVAPGWIATDSQTPAEHQQALRTPMGRSGTPEEVAGLIAYLCSTSASYLTGQCLIVDGGNSIAEERA
jgi:NAD(P)-dependent dehydrogenase (short-subunit alcohol dehydrogenase family)